MLANDCATNSLAPQLGLVLVGLRGAQRCVVDRQSRDEQLRRDLRECDARKGALDLEEFRKRNLVWKIKGKHGEPTKRDGMAAVFVMLARQASRPLTPGEKAWLAALEAPGRQKA